MRHLIFLLALSHIMFSCNENNTNLAIKEGAKDSMNLNSIVLNFEKSAAFNSARKFPIDDSVKAALSVLFDQQRILIYFDKLDKLAQHNMADYRNSLKKIDDMRSGKNLDRKAFQNECLTLVNVVKNLVISGTIADKETVHILMHLNYLLKSIATVSSVKQ